MQRIDENTYIDDTLVTCAEYQLFIDEMREQGKYYQPDHWTSYQFPKGQAHEPIFGVRYSDAEKFCNWLTQRENGEWRFRLPIQKEADSICVKYLAKNPFGYWIGKNNFQFAWVVHVPVNPSEIAFAPNIVPDYAYERAPTFDIDLTIRSAENFSSILLNFYHATKENNEGDNHHYKNILRDWNLIGEIHRTFISFRNYEMRNISNDEFDRNLDRNLELVREVVLSRYLHFTRADEIEVKWGHDLKMCLDLALEIYTYIFTLRERIAGRSPAFEGIRLVKERIR
jgi:hypothetical protein